MQSSGEMTDNSEGTAANVLCAGVTHLQGGWTYAGDATEVRTETQ